MSDSSTESTEHVEHFTPEFIRTRVLAEPGVARLAPWGVLEYGAVLAMQERLRAQRQADSIGDVWLAGEHPTVITQGVRGAAADLVQPGALPTFTIDRGGQTTLHNPGQLVIYPIVRTQGGVLAQARVSRALLATVAAWLKALGGVALEIPRGRPGLFLEGRKVAALGISIHGRVTMHGIAINLCNDLSPWQSIVPCGEPETRPATLSEVTGRRYEPAELVARLPDFLRDYWGYEAVESADYTALLDQA